MSNGTIHSVGGKLLGSNGKVAACDGDCCGCSDAENCIINPIPEELSVDLSDFEDHADNGCESCTALNGTFILTRIPDTTSWSYGAVGFCASDPPTSTLTIRFDISCNNEDQCKVQLKILLDKDDPGNWFTYWWYQPGGAQPGDPTPPGASSWTVDYWTSDSLCPGGMFPKPCLCAEGSGPASLTVAVV